MDQASSFYQLLCKIIFSYLEKPRIHCFSAETFEMQSNFLSTLLQYKKITVTNNGGKFIFI